MPTVSPRQRAVYLAAAALVLAAVVAVAVAVPVSAAQRERAAGGLAAYGDDTGLTEARQLAAAQRAAPRVRKESGQSSSTAQASSDACQGVPGLCKVPVR